MKHPCSQNQKNHAFTLIELLTVIAIIGILAAIIIPTVGKVRESARTSQCVSNMRQVATALRLYAEDTKGLLPIASIGTGQDGDTGAKDWSTAIKPYLPIKRDATGTRHAVLTCPANNYNEVSPSLNAVSHTYSMAPGSTGLNSFKNDNDGGKRRSLVSIKNPSMAIWLFEGKISNMTFKNATNNIGRGPMFTAFTTPSGNNQVQFWHGGKSRTNVAFGDSSVKGFSGPEFLARYPNTGAGFNMTAGL